MSAALVTGGGLRLGRAMALALGRRGFAVAVHYHGSKQAAEAVAAEIVAAGGRAAAVKADLSDEAETAALVAVAAAAVGPLSLLVNSASVFERDDVDSMTAESWNRHFAINLRAPVKLSQDFARQAAPAASIVNLIDQRVLKLTPQFLSYTASKAALFALTTTLAQALGPRGIRVNAIGPGPALRNARQSEADFARQCESTVLGRGGGPDEIVAALLYLVDAAAVTGQMIAVDGGQHLAWMTPDVLVNE